MQKQSHKPANSSTTDIAGRFLSAWANHSRTKGYGAQMFTLDGAPVSDMDVGSPTVLLPVFAWHADNLYKFAVKASGLGLDFNEDEEALLSLSVSLDRIQRASSEVLCFLLEAVEDARQHLPASDATPGAVEIRGLVAQFTSAMGTTLTPKTSNELMSASKLQA